MARKIISDKKPRRDKGRTIKALSAEFDDAIGSKSDAELPSADLEFEGDLAVCVPEADAATVTEERTSGATEIPSVLEILEKMQEDDPDLTAPELAFAIPEQDFVNFALWTGDASLRAKATELVRGQATYEKAVKDGFLRRAWLWINDHDPQPATDIITQKITVFDVHCPHVPLCKADYTVTNTDKIDVTVTAFGTGGGVSKEYVFEDAAHGDADCSAVQVDVDMRITPYRHRFTGKVVHLLKILHIGEHLKPGDLAAPGTDEHPCSANYPAERSRYLSLYNKGRAKRDEDFVDYDLKGVKTKTDLTHKWEITTDMHFKSTLPLGPATGAPAPTGAAPSEPLVGITVESHFITKVKLECFLVRAHNYLGFTKKRGSPIRYWAWE